MRLLVEIMKIPVATITRITLNATTTGKKIINTVTIAKIIVGRVTTCIGSEFEPYSSVITNFLCLID